MTELLGRVNTDNDPARVHIKLQEKYQTRLFAEVVAIFGDPYMRVRSDASGAG